MKSPYLTTIHQQLTSQLTSRNVNSFPRLTKVVLNYRVSDSRDSQESLAIALEELAAISGQRPRLCKSKKAVASFKLRQGEPLAYKVTLRGVRMYDFVIKLFNLVLPRLRDFKGLPGTAFDDAGNYNLTIRDQTYFPEINLDKVNRIRSVQVTLGIQASSKTEAKMLLSALGFPFTKS